MVGGISSVVAAIAVVAILVAGGVYFNSMSKSIFPPLGSFVLGFFAINWPFNGPS